MLWHSHTIDLISVWRHNKRLIYVLSDVFDALIVVYNFYQIVHGSRRTGLPTYLITRIVFIDIYHFNKIQTEVNESYIWNINFSNL